jgi:hypothetical protein
VVSEPAQSTNSKMAQVYLNAYENTTGTAQTWTYPMAFATTATVSAAGGNCAGVSTSLTTLTLPSSMSATQTCTATVIGF